MKPARLAILAIALLAGGAAAYLMSAGEPEPTPAPVVMVPGIKTTDVLVAAAEVPMGQTLKPGDLRWQAWPAESASEGLIKRSDSPKALEDTAGAIARSAFLAGEPIRREKIIRADGSGFMSAILPSGKRAIAITIDTRGATSAGGFVLPNDRVDLIRTYRDEEASRGSGSDVQRAETILSNVRVLAIGQNVQEKNGEKVVTGETATLELTPAQAEQVSLAQRSGQISLALRSLTDVNQAETPREERSDRRLNVVRFGVQKPVSIR